MKLFRFSNITSCIHAVADLPGRVSSRWRPWFVVALVAGSAWASQAQVANGGFDAAPLSPGQYLYYADQSQPVDSWTYAGNAGIATDSSSKTNFATGYPGVYAGTNYAFLQTAIGNAGSMEQSVMLPAPGAGYWLMSFSFAGRQAGPGFGGNASFRARVIDTNGNTLVSTQLVTSSGQLFNNQTLAFTAGNQGPFTLRFNNLQNTIGTDNTVFIDNVRLVLPAPPTATTLAASGVIATNATLNATVNPNGLPTSAWFQYGPTTNYGLFSPTNSLAAGDTALSVSDVISGLSPLTLYHFRIIAGNSAGGATGADQTFTTPRLPVTVSITNNGDSGPGTLRQAILNSAPGDTILFDASLSGSSILLTSGQLLVTNNLTIDVSALPGGLTVTGNGNTRLFNVSSSATAVLTGLTLSNGVAVNNGGGIFNAGTLTLNRCTLAGNSAIGTTGSTGASGYPTNCGSGSPGGTGAMGAGGAIYNQGTLTVNECTLAGNLAQGGTGGEGGDGANCLGAGRGGNAGNGGDGGPGAGGAIYNTGVLAINQCTLATNTASGGRGGSRGGPGYGSDGFGIDGNPGSDGSGTGGGICQSNALTLFNSIVPGNSPDNIVGTMVATGDNLTNGNPLLSALGNNGGPTPTMLLLPGSPAFDNGAPTSFTSDQRGFPRISGAAPDIGAVEMTSDVVTLPATDVTGTAATLNGTVNPNGTATSVFFQYGTNTNYGSFTSTNALANSDTALLVQGPITNLQLSNTYHFRIVAISAFGPIRGADQTFTAGVAGAAAPSVSSLVATVIATNGASGGVRSVQLSAFVNPNGGTTAAYFEYGPTTAYPGTNHIVSASAANLAVTLGFSAGSTYHWRVVATNAVGAAISPDQTFWLGSSALAGDLNGDGVVSQDELDAVYANYVTNSPWLYMTNVTGLGDTNVTFALSNSVLGAYTVQFSTNLADWFDLGPASPRYLFTDTNAPAVPQRYYRLRYP
jgi:hypothetical protein